MPANNSIVAIYKTHLDAESAIKELQKSGFDMKKLSIVAKDFETSENVVGYYKTGDRMATWGKLGAFWGWIWGLLFGSALLIIPGVGPVVVGGPIVGWIVGALETAVIAGGLSALSAGLYSIGIPKESVLKYETALKAEKFLVIAHGIPEEVDKAKKIIDGTHAEDSDLYRELAAQAR